MRLRRTTRALTSWIGALAILLAALAPSISHALGSKNASWIEVCTSMGAKWVQSDGTTDQSPAPADAHVFEHCPYCSLHADALALPRAPAVLPLVISFAHEFPPAFLAAPRTLYAWVSAQPRAPPHFS